MPIVHEHRIRVRYAETDQMGVVYHANHLVYMEEARIRLMEALGFPYAEVEAQGLGMVVRKAEIRYRAPIRFDDEVLVRTRIPRLGGATILYAYELLRASTGELLAEATTEVACIRIRGEERRATPLPHAIRSAIEAGLPPHPPRTISGGAGGSPTHPPRDGTPGARRPDPGLTTPG